MRVLAAALCWAAARFAAPAEAAWEPTSDEAPFSVLNNASNGVVLANCLERYELGPGEELQMATPIGAGFWVLPNSSDFNCSLGCADCYYVATQWTVAKGEFIQIGFGLPPHGEADGGEEPVHPRGGGMELLIAGAGRARCTDQSCTPGWNTPVSFNATDLISVIVQGSESAAEEGSGVEATVAAARFRRIGRPVFRRPVFRRPIYRRPIFRRPIYRRPIYRPIIGHPVYTPTCYWCSQFGAGTCWWLCR